MRIAPNLFVFWLSLSAVVYGGTISIPGNSTITVGFAATTYGQTFVVPTPTSEDILTQFSLTFQGSGTYHALIYQWSGDPNAPTGNAVGSALFDSGALTAPASLTQVFFNTGGILLDPALAYVAFSNWFK